MARPTRAYNADAGDTALERRFVTPEGVDLRLQLASAGERAAAFCIDVFAIVAILTVVSLLLGYTGLATEADEVVIIVWLLLFFFLRSFYFTFFELRPGAATPGKRVLGLRIAPRNGGRLRAEAVFARNAMREIEVFLPISFFFAQGPGGVDGWIIFVGSIWGGIFAFFPLFNRDRLRPGDMIAGTWVVKAPKRRLQEDMARAGEEALPAFQFSAEELDAYGAHELHVLEDVLRTRNEDTIALVADRIRTKIGRNAAPDEDDATFLDAYYAALRARLEQLLLFGVKRRDKHDRDAKP
ncbi:MAG: RDD family protein [Pseudomonadota bacterium]